MSTIDDHGTGVAAHDQAGRAAARSAPIVVITGSTSGFGAALAHALARLDANVVVAGRDAGRAAAVARAIGQDQALGLACDVQLADDIAALWEAAVERFGRVDHWINNAGVGHRRVRLDQLSVEETTTVLTTNLAGARRALEGMLAQGGGRIWLTEGLGSSGPVLAGTGPYSASKAGATRAYEVLAKECRGTPVSVGFLRPGIMPTRVALGSPNTDQPPRTHRIANLLGDRPEHVAHHFAPKILGARANGQRLTWLTPSRIARRLLAAPFQRRHVFDGSDRLPDRADDAVTF